MEGESVGTSAQFPANVGERLRAAREAQGLDITEIASRTRIPQRHLEAIESSNYTGLPSITYAMGFAKSYARAVGADEVEIARLLRAELGSYPERAAPTPSYEMDDPTRVPPRGIAMAGAIVALLVLIGVGLWYGTNLFRGTPPAEAVATAETNTAAAATNTAAPAAAPAPTGGQVTLVAQDTVWLRVNDGAGKRLFEKEMAAGERYDVPMDAQDPRVRTGRPDRIQVLINGSNVPPLGTGVETVNVAVSAQALQARGQPDAAAADNATTAP
jgi:cytoskeleton protein RodZ